MGLHEWFNQLTSGTLFGDRRAAFSGILHRTVLGETEVLNNSSGLSEKIGLIEIIDTT